jgi:hypothetical protein
MSTISIRLAHMSDAPAIADNTCKLALESSGTVLNKSCVLGGVEFVLRRYAKYGDDPESLPVIYFVATNDSHEPNVAGHTGISAEWNDWYAAPTWISFATYVADRKGNVGVRLVQHSLDHVRAIGERYARERARSDMVSFTARCYIADQNKAGAKLAIASGASATDYRVYDRTMSLTQE